MSTTSLNSLGMTPKKTITVDVWYCRHCLAERPIKGQKPKRCWNYKCRRMDWDREKIKAGRPRKGGKRRAKRRKGK